MKKTLPVLLAIVMCLSLCACGTETTTQEKNTEAIVGISFDV